MRIPACRLLDYLTPGLTFEVRRPELKENSGFAAAMPYTDAVAAAIRGEVEGVAAPSGRIKYLRVLPENERTPAPERVESTTDTKGSVLAQTRMGAYRQKVYSSQMDNWGAPTAVVIGQIWQLHGVHV